jgi:hypothetical protein
MKYGKHFVLAAIAVALLAASAACDNVEKQNPGPAEKAGAAVGQAIDQATEKAGEAVEKAGDAMKDAGEKAKEYGKDVIGKTKEAADNIKDTK